MRDDVDERGVVPGQNRLKPVIRIGVVGTGTMGRGIAQTAARAGLEVCMVDARTGAADEARAAIAASFDALVAKGHVDSNAAAASMGRLTCVATLDALADCELVVEAVVEDLAVKRALFRKLEDVVADDAILATNTSSLSVTGIAAACRIPQRVIGWHFFNPVPVMRIAEVVPGLLTLDDVARTVSALTARMGHHAVPAKDTPGFVVNHAGRAYIPEGLRLLSEGIASHDHIDAVMRDCAGFRMGPFELVDLIGLDNARDVMESLYHLHYEEPRFRITPLVATRVAAGLLGRKSGQGFYCYNGSRPASPSVEVTTDQPQPPVWIAPHEGDLAERVRTLLASTGVFIEPGPAPSDDALIIITPVGVDVSTACARWHLDAKRTIAIDALFSLQRRCVLMAAPDFDDRWRIRALSVFASTGRRLTLLRDSPGFVAQRIVSQIVSIGCDMAQHRIALPADIDAAVTLALGYPTGPFGFGHALGVDRLLDITTALEAAYGEPRYRPSVWLRRRALGGLAIDQLD